MTIKNIKDLWDKLSSAIVRPNAKEHSIQVRMMAPDGIVYTIDLKDLTKAEAEQFILDFQDKFKGLLTIDYERNTKTNEPRNKEISDN